MMLVIHKKVLGVSLESDIATHHQSTPNLDIAPIEAHLPFDENFQYPMRIPIFWLGGQYYLLIEDDGENDSINDQLEEQEWYFEEDTSFDDEDGEEEWDLEDFIFEIEEDYIEDFDEDEDEDFEECDIQTGINFPSHFRINFLTRLFAKLWFFY